MILLYFFIIQVLTSPSYEEIHLKKLLNSSANTHTKVCEVQKYYRYTNIFKLRKYILKFINNHHQNKIFIFKDFLNILGYNTLNTFNIKPIKKLFIKTSDLTAKISSDSYGYIPLINFPLNNSDYPLYLSFELSNTTNKKSFLYAEIPANSQVFLNGKKLKLNQNSFKLKIFHKLKYKFLILLNKSPDTNPWFVVSSSISTSYYKIFNPKLIIPKTNTKNIKITYFKNNLQQKCIRQKAIKDFFILRKLNIKNKLSEIEKWNFYEKYLTKGDYLKKNYRCKMARLYWKKAKNLTSGLKAELKIITSLGHKGFYLSAIKNLNQLSSKYKNIPAIQEIKAQLESSVNLNPTNSYKSLYKMFPWSSEYSYLYAKTLLNKGEKQKAIEILSKNWKINKDFYILKELFKLSSKSFLQTANALPDQIFLKKLQIPQKNSFKLCKNRIGYGFFDQLISKYSFKTDLSKYKGKIPEKSKIILDDYIILVDKLTLAHAYHHRIFQVGKEDLIGNSKYKFSFYYTPDIQNYKTLRASVYRINNKTQFFAGSTKTIKLDFPKARTFFDIRKIEYEFVDLHPGDIINLEYIKEELPEATTRIGRFGFGAYIPFEGNYPSEKIQFKFFIYKNLNVKLHPYPKKIFKQKQLIYKNLKGFIYDLSLLKVLGADHPTIFISFNNSWKNLGKYYTDYINNNYVHNNNLKKLTLNIIKNTKTKTEKIQKIHEYVLKNFRYVSLMFGLHGYIPYSINEILIRKFGDCKDMTLILTTMLKYAGIKAVPALVKTYGDGSFPKNIPSLAPFDHSIVYLPDEKQWVDTTTKGISYPLTPWHIQGRNSLIINGSKSFLAYIPEDKPKQNLLRQIIILNFLHRTKSFVNFKMIIKGQREDLWRRMIGNSKQARYRFGTWIKKFFNGIKLLNFNTNNLKHLKSPLVIKSKFKIKNRKLQNKNKFNLNFGLKRLLLSMLRHYQSNKTFYFPFREIIQTNITILLPKRKFYQINVFTKNINNKWFQFEQNIKYKRKTVQVNRTFILKTKQINKKEYNEFKTEFEKVISYISIPLIVTKWSKAKSLKRK